jgi:hypothetical protein
VDIPRIISHADSNIAEGYIGLGKIRKPPCPAAAYFKARQAGNRPNVANRKSSFQKNEVVISLMLL